MYAQRTFMDGNQKTVRVGDEVKKEDYDEKTLKSYQEKGLVGDKNPMAEGKKSGSKRTAK